MIILLSVMVMSFTGCGNSESYETESATYNSEDMEIETVEQKEDSEPTEIADAETESEKDNSEKTEVTESEADESAAEEETKTPETEGQKPENGKEEQKPEEAVKPNPTPEPKPEPSAPEPTPEPKPEPKVESVAYDPNAVVSLAIAKCQAGGMVTTQDNLSNALAEGRITQEEYNAYYPYDGLESSYYSVFVETDLNIASTTSGRRLGSVDEIATHISEMLLLESNPVFNIVYAGVYNLNGTDFYEFRCLR